MELLTLVAVGLSIVLSLVSIGNTLARTIGCMFLYPVDLTNGTEIGPMDIYVGRHGILSPRSLRGTPSDGWHLLRRGLARRYQRDTSKSSGFDTVYEIYWFSAAARDEFRALVYPPGQIIYMDFFESRAPWRSSLSAENFMFGRELSSMWRWQRKLVEQLVELFAQGSTASALVCGPPDMGKSEVVSFLCLALAQKYGYPSTRLLGVDLCSPGIMMTDFLAGVQYRPGPTVLELPEYDTTIEYALTRRERTTEATAIAENKNSLTAALDLFSRTRNLVIVATSNQELGWFEREPSRLPFVRGNRLRVHVETESK
jgi:hypothetical protein